MKKGLTLVNKLDAAEAVIDAYVEHAGWSSSDMDAMLRWIDELRKTVRRLDEGGTE